MNRLFTLLLLFSAILAAAPSRVIKLGGSSITAATHTLVIPAEATPSEHWAAEEFNLHWRKMTGETLPVATEPSIPEGKYPIYLGRCAGIAALLGQEPNWELLGTEGIMIASKGPALVLAGGRRGVLYALYDFLQQELGCRWFAEDCEVLPDSGTVELPELNRTYLPPFEYRDTDYPERRPPEFGVRNFYNGLYSNGYDPKWGGNVSYHGFVHTFERLVPPEKYAAAHPEWYALIHGKRNWTNTQLCLTNPEVLQVVIDEVRAAMRRHPEQQIFSVSQNDNKNYCTCEKCTALAEAEGSQAGPLLHFVNAVADAVREEFPDKIIDTLAYQYTRKPPKHVVPAPNVAVRLCSIECCFVHPLEDNCPDNLAFREDIEKWSTLTKRLHIWDYVINYAHTEQPFPNLRVLKKNINFFLEHGVTGIYEEANYFSRNGELAPLRAYLMGQCLWRPDFDIDEGIRQFCDAYYGAASTAIQRYLTILHDTVCNDLETHVTIYEPPENYLHRPAMLDQLEECFDLAEAAVADDPLRLRRVKTARIPLTYTQLQLKSTLFNKVNDTLVGNGKLNETLVRRFPEDVRAAGITAFFEGGDRENGFKTYLQGVEGMTFNQPIPLATLQNQNLKLLLVPAIGGRILAANTRLSNQPVFKIHGSLEGDLNPYADGYEEYFGGGYRAPGWNIPFKVTEQSTDEITMVGLLPEEVRIERKISLTDNGFRITSQVRGNQEQPAQPHRVHPSFNISDVHNVELWIKRAATWKRVDFDPDLHDIEVWLKNDSLPAGAWGFTDRGTGLAILVTFRQPTVESCYFFANPRENFANLEAFSTSVPVGPESGPMLDLEYAILPYDQAPWNH
ncbi:MAG: DUF4838 domain-containing protein [Victivallales bacterium]|nr:DUF4838 domain-containing protein [Victivallales bacterium]